MIPKKANKFYKDVAEDLNIEESLVEDVIEFFYKEVRTTLSNLSHPRINVEGLGHFVAKSTLIKKAIPRYTKSLENHDTSTFGAYFNKKKIEQKLDLLIKLEQQIITEEERKDLFKKKKDEEYIKTNLGEQEADPGGDNQ
jgi:nucleoid DNA-binding protein